MRSRPICMLSLLWLPLMAQAQSGSTYYDVSLDSDGVTVDGVEVMDSSMTGPGNCDHNYQMEFYFENTSYDPIGTNDQTFIQTDPANQSESFRIDDSMVGNSGTTYYVSTSASAFCECVSKQFVQAGGTSVLSIHTTYFGPLRASSGGFCSYSKAACSSGTPTCPPPHITALSYPNCNQYVRSVFLVLNGTCQSPSLDFAATGAGACN